MKKLLLLSVVLFLGSSLFASTYYSQGTAVFNTLTTWNDIRGGGGNSPAAFNIASDVFVIQSGHTITTNATIAFAAGSKVQIEAGGILTASHLFTSLGIFQVDNLGTYNHNAPGSGTNGSSTDFPGSTGAGRVFGATSNVNINAWALSTSTSIAVFPTIAAPGWGNFNINVPTWGGTMNMVGNFSAVQGNLDINSTGGPSREFRLTSNTAANTTSIGGNLTINGGLLGITSGTSTFAQVLNIGGNLIINAGTGQIANPSGNTNVTINVTGAISISGGATPAITSTVGTTFNVGNGMSISSGTFSLGTSSSHITTLNITGDLNISGTGIMTNTSSSNNTVTCTGNFNLSGTGLYQMQNSSTSGKTHVLNIGGNFNMTGGTFNGGSNSSTGKVNFTGGASSVTYTQSGGTVTTSKNTDWTIAVGKTVTLNNDFVYQTSPTVTSFSVNGTLNCATNNLIGANNFVLGAGGTLKIGSAAGISSTASTGSIQSTGARTYPTTANYEYNGSLAQVTGNQLPATVNSLTINNAAGVSLTGSVAATSLALNSGKLSLGANNISANTLSNGSSANYVITDGTGALKINGVGATNIIFPVGPSASAYNPITINNTGTTDNFSVKVKPSFTNAPFDATKVVNIEWIVGKDGSATGNNVSLTPQWNGPDEAAGFTRGNSVVIGHYGAMWDETASNNASGAGPYTTTATGFTSFSPFAVGNAGAFFSNTPPNISLSSNNPAIPAGNLYTSSTKNSIYNFSTTISTNSAILNAVNFTTAGTYAAADITKLQLWYNSTNDLSTAAQVGSDITTALGSGAHAFSGLTHGVGNGITGYFWVTADIASGATLNNTINVSAITTADLVFSSGNKTGTAYAGLDQTILIGSNLSDYFRTTGSGDWASPSKWESSIDGATNWHVANISPTSAATNALIKSPNVIAISTAISSTSTSIEAGAELDIIAGGTLSFGASKTITINGTLKQIGTLTMGTSTFAIGATGVYENAVPATNTNILIPTATPWTAGSTCKITGVVGTAGANPTDYNLTSGIGQAFSNFVIDLPNLIGKYVLTNQATLATAQFSANSLTVNATGSSTYGVQLTSSGKQEVINTGSYTQNGGIVSILHNSNNATSKALNVTGSFTLTASAIFNISAYTSGAGQSSLSVGGNLAMSSLATLQKNTTFGTGGTAICVFNGSAAQTATFGITSGAVNYNVNNAAGVTLGGSLSTSGSLILTSGNLTLGAFNASANAVSGGSATNFVVTDGAGALTINNLAASTSTLFPVGTSISSYSPVTLATNAAHTTDNFSVRVGAGVLASGNAGASFTTDWVNRGWYISEGTPGGSDVNLSLQWAVTNELPSFDRNDCTISHWDGSVWDDLSTGAATGTDPYTITRNSVSTFSPFGVRKHSGVTPITLVSFGGSLQNSQVKLIWSTANEGNMRQFIVEKSMDAKNYSPIGTVGALNGQSNKYNFADVAQLELAYYRLKMVDNDGKYTYSNVVAINNKNSGSLGIFPNPVKNSIFITHQSAVAGASMEVYSMGGKLVMAANCAKGSTFDSINAESLSAGNYILAFKNGENRQVIKFIKQ